MAEVALERVGKRYGDVVAVDAVSLAIADGELMVLVGPSGCGKSTLLRMIAGLEQIAEGTVAIGGRVVNDVPAKERDIAMVFQSYALYPHMTVRENLEFALKIRRMPRPERDQRVAEAAAILGIETLLERRPKALSGGQRQRVAVGRAIVRQPAVFLFDEPLSNLDAKLRVQMRAELTKLHQRLGVTIVYVTHDQVEAMTLGDRIAVLKDGRLQQVGAPLEVYERPTNAFVASFIGTPRMNLLEGHVNDDGTRLEGNGFALPVPSQWSDTARATTGRPVLVGIRPEHLFPPGAAVPGPSAPLLLQLELVETLGHEAIAHGRVGGTPLTAAVEAHFRAEPGTAVELGVLLAGIHLFDGATGERLEPGDDSRRPAAAVAARGH
jgi:multiple sugar transport system ATP-binding protein